MMRISSGERTSMQVVFPPKPKFSSTGVGVEPRTPQNFRRIRESFIAGVKACFGLDYQTSLLSIFAPVLPNSSPGGNVPTHPHGPVCRCFHAVPDRPPAG